MLSLIVTVAGLLFIVGAFAVLVVVGIVLIRRAGELNRTGVPVRSTVVDTHQPAVSAVPGRSRLGIFFVVVGCAMGGVVLLSGLIGVVVAFVR